jgi:enoyl-CoA hydratase
LNLEEAIRLEWREGAAWLRIDRPDKRGAMSHEMWLRLQALAREALEASPVAIVVAGVPGQFASGADIAEFASVKATEGAARASFEAVDGACRALFEAPVPTIAAVDGYALGGGLELLAACDLRIATRSARFGLPSARLGVTIGHGHVRRLVWAVGPSRALAMLLTARSLDATEALACGLVHELADDWQALMAAATATCRRLAGLSPQSLRWSKEAVHRVLADPALAGLEDDAGQAIRAFASDEFREGARAFLERRPPRFRDLAPPGAADEPHTGRGEGSP